MKAVNMTFVAVDNGDIEDQLSHNSRKRQHKTNAHAAEITTGKAKLNKALEENIGLKNLFHLEKMVEAMTKQVSTLTMKEHPKKLRALKYKGTSNYIGRE